MIQGSNPLQRFRLPFDVSRIKTFKAIYAQDKRKILEKKTEDCTMEGNVVSFRLTQEDTLSFDSDCNLSVQVRVLDVEGNSLVSRPKQITVWELYDDEVLA